MNHMETDPNSRADRLSRSHLLVRPMDASDAVAVLEIYRDGLATGHATFQDTVPSWHEWDRTHLITCRLVVLDGDRLAGWAALSPVSARPVYRGVAEISLYVSAASRGHGVGRALLETLSEAADQAGIWTLQSGIFPENRASLALHDALGFRRVGTRQGLGLMTYGPCAGQWRDVIMLERRSSRVGTT